MGRAKLSDEVGDLNDDTSWKPPTSKIEAPAIPAAPAVVSSPPQRPALSAPIVPEKTIKLLIPVRDRLHRKLKAKAAERGTNLDVVCADLLQAAISAGLLPPDDDDA